MKSNKNTGNGISGKGYYIALILCAVAIGISGYMYYQSNTDPQLNGPSLDANGSLPGDDIQAVATQPSLNDPNNGGQTPTLPPKPINTTLPVSGDTVAEYAMDCLSYNPTTRDWRVHNGIDIAAEAGSAVRAAADGEVYTVYEDETMGTTVVIRHDDGYTTKYSSLAETVLVEPGDAVTAGQTIGAVGNTALMESAIGDHVHFSVTCDGELVDPADFLSPE